MIPLGQWLANRPLPAFEASPPLLSDDFALPVAETLSSPAGDLAETAEAARAAGEAAGRVAAEAEFAEQLQRQSEALRAEAEAARSEAVALAREAWCAEQSEVMEVKFAAAFATLEQDLARSISHCLQPFLEERARQLAVNEFSAALKTLAAQESQLRLEAPADLIAALKARPGGVPAGVDVQVAEHGDLLAVAGGTLLESGLVRWLAAIREAAP